MRAPEIVASGRGIRARAIKRAARRYQVPVIHNVRLARSLYRDGEPHEMIPEEYYEPVAEVLKFAYAMGRQPNSSQIDREG
jgi:flagellar biosynthetic protein FlhB